MRRATVAEAHASEDLPGSDVERPPAPKPSGKVRWIVCALLFFAVVLSYVDRCSTASAMSAT
jgi:hypothetical protein